MVSNTIPRRTSSLFITFLILCFVALLLFVSLINGARNLTILCITIFTLAGTLKIWSQLASKKWSSSLLVNRTRVFAGESLTVSMKVINSGMLPASFEAAIPTGSLDLNGDSPSAQAEGILLWFQSYNHSWDLGASHRGVHYIGPLNMITGDILGFYMKEAPGAEQIEIIVYPKLVPLRPFTIPRREFFGIPGGESPVDDPIYILGTVDYHFGRPAKHIHWKASARHHKLQQKVFEPTEQEKVLLVVDTEGFDENNQDAFEEILEIVASLAAALDRRGCAIGLMTNGSITGSTQSVSVTRNPFQIQIILEILARISCEHTHLMSHMAQQLIVPWGTTCLYFCFENTESTDLAKAHFLRCRAPLVLFTYEQALLLREESILGYNHQTVESHIPYQAEQL
jgi:uncharacterized protein (DUF58 family)